MPYSSFNLKRVKAELNINLIETQGVFEKIEPVEISQILKDILEEHIPLAVSINTEKARSELIIANILVEVRDDSSIRSACFPGWNLMWTKKKT